MNDETIFAVALEKPDAAERAAYLNAACADAGQRKRVEGLLAALDAAGGFLEKPAVGPVEGEAAATRAFRAPELVKAGDGPTRTQGEDTDHDADDALGFLAPAERPDSLGRIGHYEVLEVLGRGGFGVVFRAFDEKLQRVVAVKVLAPSMAATSPARKRFLREARSAAQVQHENVVRIHDTAEEPLPYLVMEFVPGETLQDRLDRTGPLEAAEALKIARQVSEGLAAAHDRGLIHRDIKPSNILIDSGPQQQVKITDFGLARAADDASLTRSGTVAGTPMYMAPEQAKGEVLDHRADLFSLGSVLYAMLAGRPPFRAETTLAVLKRVAEDTPRPIREVIPEVPEWLCRIVEKLHAKNPAERFQSAKEVAELLADCERQLQAHKELKDTSRIPNAPPPRTSGIRLGWPAILGAALLLPISIAGIDGANTSSVSGWFAFVAAMCMGPLIAVLVVGISQKLGWIEAGGGKPVAQPATAPRPRRVPVALWFICAAVLIVAVARGGFALGAQEILLLLIVGVLAVLLLRQVARVPDDEAVARAVRRSRASRWVWAAVAILALPALAAVLLTAIPFPYLYATNQADLVFLSHADPDVERLLVKRDGEVVAKLDRANLRATVEPGEYELEAECIDGYEATKFHVETARVLTYAGSFQRVEGRPVIKLTLRRGDTTSIAATAERRAAPPWPPAPDSDGFVPLFNGKDLTGWKEVVKEGTNWKVQDGVLQAISNPPHISILNSVRDDYKDFHLRLEMRSHTSTRASLNWRTDGMNKVPGYGIWLMDVPGTAPVFSLSRWTDPDAQKANPVQIKQAEWFVLEVIARGSEQIVKVDGQTVVHFTDDKPINNRGTITLLQLPNCGFLEFRKIEVKDLSPAAVTPLDREELAKLKGEWLVRLEGRPAPVKEDETLAIRFGDGDFEFRFPGADKPQAGTFQVDAANKQLLLKLTGQTVPFRCPYRVEGDSLRFTLALPGSGDAKPLTADEFLRMRALMHASNTIKQQAIGLHNYHEATGALPPAALTSKDGKPLLSWRVAILPHIGEDNLYKEFKLDEPWDSEHNKKLIEKMPAQFALRHRKPAEPGLTHLRVIVGPGTAFDPRSGGVKLNDIPDGTMNTLLVAEAADPVIWTKPEELSFDPKGKLPKLGTPEEGALVARCDTSVMILAPNPPDAALRAFITRNGGEPVPELPLKSGLLQPRSVQLECLRRVAAPIQPPPTVTPIGAAPQIAVAPFGPKEAKSHQEAWAAHLGVPTEYENPVGMKFRLIPPGEFLMGSPPKEIEAVLDDPEIKARPWAKDWIRAEGPARRTTVAEPFYVGVHEVTVGQFRQFVAARKYRTVAEKNGGGLAWNPKDEAWAQAASHVWNDAEFVGSESHPVGFMTLADAKEFCAWLGERDGLEYVVPTEVQWEFACRAGTTTRWYFGDDPGAMKDHGWTEPHADSKHRAVGRLAANPFGLFDLHGNAHELALDPKGNPVERGGDAGRSALWARSGSRLAINKPDGTVQRRGFRVAIVGNLKPKPPAKKKEPDLAVVQPLRDAVAARGRTVADVKKRFEAGVVGRLEVIAAEVELREAQIKLAEAEGDGPILVLHLRELVKLREEERELVKLRVEVGADRAAALDAADARLADARARRARLDPPAVAPAPREKGK